MTNFRATVSRTVRHMLSVRCLSVCLCCLSCSVCNVRVLWPNGWMDQDETWHGGRPRPRPHCVRWGPSSPPKGAQPSPQFLAHVSCGETTRWMQMPLSMEADLNPGDFVLDGDPAPPTERGTARKPPVEAALVVTSLQFPIQMPCPCSPMVKPLGRHVQ